jgi:hypothetical protein
MTDDVMHFRFNVLSSTQGIYALLRARRREPGAALRVTTPRGRNRCRRNIRPTCRKGGGHGNRCLPRLAGKSHGRDPDHRSFELARHHGRRRRPRSRGSLSRRCRHRRYRTGRGRRRRGDARRHARNLRLIHHQHRSLEFWRRHALQSEVALGAGLRHLRVLRAAVRTEHSTTSGREHSGSRSRQPSANCSAH